MVLTDPFSGQKINVLARNLASDTIVQKEAARLLQEF